MRHALPDAATLFRRSSLLLSPALPHAQRIDLYATTHLVFHLADFGARDIAGATPVEIARIHDDLGLALSTCLAERDFDLSGEFLIARLCLRGTPGPLDRHAARALCQAQQPSGFVPDRSWLDGLAPTDDAEARARQEFQAVYHPTLVALILLACDMAGDHPGGRVR